MVMVSIEFSSVVVIRWLWCVGWMGLLCVVGS